MWVRFLKAFDFSPPERRGRVTIAYKAGMVCLVRKCCGEAAIAIGAATKTERPKR